MGKKKTRCVGRLSNIMYFYNRKFPEHGISEMKIVDMREELRRVETGVFGAHMEVSLVNNGPVTIVMDSKVLRK